MTSGGNDFNNLPETQLTRFQLGGKNVTIQHICCTVSIQFVHGRKTGHLASREGLGRDAETMRPKYGMSQEIQDGWQP